MLTKDSPAPDFSTPDQNGKSVSLSDFKGKKNVILYFYPKDDTPGCTIEANDFTKFADELSKLDTAVLGVSRDSCQSHIDFINKFSLSFDLLSDESGELCEKYGVWQEKEKNGVKKMGIVRSTFIIDKNGILQHAEYGVNPEGHAAAMTDFIQKMNG